MSDIGITSVASRGPTIHYQRIVDAFAWTFILCGAIALVEPSPYDFASMATLPLWFLGGFAVHRSFILFGALILTFTFMGFVSLVPYYDNPDSVLYQYQSAYLTVTALFFALFFSERTQQRTEIALSGYTAGALIAAFCGILGYFDVVHLGELFSKYGRASGTFKDPNVLGSYLILSTLYLVQKLMFARTRHVVATALALVILLAGVFLSFSRGSWGATIFALALMGFTSYATSADARFKRRVMLTALFAVVAVAVVLIALLSIESTRSFFLQRAAVAQDYDAGETGRFGNQLRSLPMLLDRFWGFGSLRFRLYFGLDPHNSYIGAFANNGWMGGLSYLLLVGVTAFVGWRLMFRASPYQRTAQVFVPTLLAFDLQAFQIDVDHWRHVLLLYGVVWGLEAARQKWETREGGVVAGSKGPPAQLGPVDERLKRRG
jgi:O-antigen ligase